MANNTVILRTDILLGPKLLTNALLTSSMDVNWLIQRFVPSIQLSTFSIPSDRLSPQVILHTICEVGVLFKVTPFSADESTWSEFKSVHNSCIQDRKSLFVHIEGRELHLVAVESTESRPYFWAYVCRTGQYSVCCNMLNQRTLALVFDLDETLIIANTMKSFDDRIASAERRLRAEPDPEKQAQYADESASLQRDKDLLRDYMDRNKVTIEEKEFEAEYEEAPSAVTPGVVLQRPIIRLPDGVILTRINPTNRDTSVLIKIRPFWEDLREYILIKGRKRFEPFVCTLSEKEYAWEVWRLLDPGGRLIEWGALRERVVCVRPDIKKSILGVFSGVCCNPSMAIVIDDRLKVWEEEDQSRVHVVPQYAPYSNPGLEEGLELPVMHTARNAIYNTRAAYFKYVDEDLVQTVAKLTPESDPKTLPPRPDVSTFLKAEPSFPLAPIGGAADGLTGPEERAQLGKGPRIGEESGTKDSTMGGDTGPEVSSASAGGGEKRQEPDKGPAPMEKGETDGHDKGGDAVSDGVSGEGAESDGVQARSEEGKGASGQGESRPPQRTSSDVQRMKETAPTGEKDGVTAKGVQLQNAVNALSSLSGGQQITHEQLAALLAAAPLLVNAAPQLAAILPQIQTLYNLQQQQQHQVAPLKPPTPPGQPPPAAHPQPPPLPTQPRPPVNPPLPPGPPPPEVIEQARAARPSSSFPGPKPPPSLPPGFLGGIPRGVTAQPPRPPGAPPGPRPATAGALQAMMQQVQGLQQQQEQRQKELKEQARLQQALQNQPPHFPMLGGRLPSPRGGPVLPSPRGFPRALPPGMPGLWEARPSPRVQHQFPPDHVEPADDRSGSDDPSEPEVDDEEPFEGGNGSEGGKDSGDELEAGGGAEDYPSGEEGGSFSSGSSAERARAQERAKQREEAEAAVEGGVEEGELLSEEEGALASGDDGGIPSIPSSRSASVEPMDEEPAPSSDEPMSFAASDGPFGAQAAAGALFGGLDFRALADDSYGEDQPGTSGAPGFDAETGSAKPGNGKREVLTELHTLGRSMGRDVTYRFIKVANGPPVTAQVLMQGRVVGEGHGPNKRLAKHNGARQVLEMLQGQGGSRPVPLPGLPNQGHPAPPHPVPGQQNAPRPSRPPPMQEVRNVYHGQAVEFEELASEGPPHKKTFTFQVKVDGVPVAVASGPSKKVAKQHASQEAIRRKPMMDQMWHAQPAQAPPPHPPSAKRPASDSEPDPAPAVKRVRTSDTAFGVSPTPTAESLFPAVPGGAFPAGGHPLQGTAAFGGFQESVAQGAPLTPGQWAGGQFPLPGGQGPGAPAAVGRGRGVLSPGKKAGKGGALGAKKKLKQSAKTKTRRDTPELTAAKRDSAPIFVQDSEVMR